MAVGAVGELRLTAADAAAADLLGESVAIDGDYLVVGSPGGDDGFADAGAAYVYRFDGSTWLEHERLLANDPGEGDGFGGSVAISGETIIVGAAGHDAAALAGAGAAYVFVLEGGSWVIQDKLLPDDGTAGDAFGSSVTIDGDVIAVGAITAATDVGAAYVFGRSDSVWSQQDKLLADGGLAGDGFGAAVDLSGDRIVVGAPGDDDGGDAAGAAYVFQRNESDWAFLSKLAASDSAAGDAFGASVAIGGSTVVVGATGSDTAGDNAGSAYIFVEQAGSWDQQQPLSAPDASAGDQFGSAVDIRIDGSGALVLVGAMHNQDAVDGAGAAYLFDRSGTDWNLRAKLAADDGATDDRFGAAVALGAQRLVIGSAGSDGFGGVAADDAGAAYAYLLNRFDAPVFLPRESRGNIEANELGEASGMVASRQSPGVLWAHNDSGGQRRVFAMDSRGEHLGIFGLDDVVHRDWEDIAIGPGPLPGVQYLYIADSGNNSAQTGNPHPNIRIYRVAEPVVDPDGGDQSASLGVVDTFTLTYPDEAWDNETLLVDPWTGDLVLVTKRAEFNHVYRLAAPGPGDLTAELEYVGNMIWGDQPPGDGSNSGIVGGDVSPTGREIILKNYHEIALFHRPLGISLAEALVGVIPELLPYVEMPKGEGLSFDAEGAGYFTLGERENRPDAPIDYYPRDFSSDIATVAEFQQGVVPTPAYDKTQDTLLQQTAPTANFGSSELLTVSGDDGAAGEDALAVLQWGDLSAVPSNSPIQAVSLTFDVTDATSGSGYQLFELRRDWSEGDASFNRATDDDAWQEPGAAGVEDRGTTVLGTVNPSTTGRFTMTLNQAGVDVVQSWILDPSTNHGFLLVGSDNGDALSLSSSEATDPRLRPKLSIGFLRPDDVAPTAEIISPVDNGPLDQDPADDRLLLNPTPLFEFQLTDRELDDASVTSETVVITRNDAPLIDGVDYVFDYDAPADRIRLTPTSSKFDVGVYHITLSPAGQSIVDATGNEMLPREFFVSLDDSFPTPLEEVSPPGSLIYRRDTQGSIVSAGDSQTFSIDLDAGQTIAVVVSPAASLRPTIRVEGPAGELIGLPVEAAAVGDRTVLQAALIDDAGAYKIFIGETGDTSGAFAIELILGAYAPVASSPVVLDTAISLGGSADRLAALGQTGQQSYQFHLAAGQSATIALNALGTSAVNMELLKDGLRVALPATDATNVTHRIEGLGSLTDADYTVSVNAGGGAEYSLLVTRDATFEFEPNNSLGGGVDITRSGVALGGFSSREVTSDFYHVSVTEGDVLDISTSAPGDGAGEPVNLLTLQLQLFDPAGQPVASGDQISFSDTVDGQYSIRVRTTGGTTGAYILRVEGHTGTPPAFAVAETTFDEVAGELTVDFNRSVSLASLNSSDLKINGQTARGFSIVDGQRVVFRVPQLSILAGSINMSIDAGLIEDLAGEPIAEFVTSFSRPLFAAPPSGSLLYGQGIAGRIATAGATQQFLLELDSSQFVSLLLVPTSETLQPTLQLIGPGGEPQSFEATAPGEILLAPPIDIDSAGAYTVVVGGVGDTAGDFMLQVIVNGLAENEEFLASTNDQMVDAEDIDAGFSDLDPAGAMQRVVVFGTANAALPDTVIDSGFNDNTEGFRYVDDAFNSTTNPERATGSREANGGFDGGALQVFLPRGGGFFGGLPRDPASGAWVRSFDLAEDATVEVALWYRLVLGQPVDGDEFGEVILELDGVRLGTDQNGSLIHTDGNDGNDNSGWLFAVFTVDLSAGEHELKLGVYNNKSTSRNETVEARFDDVTVRVQGGGGPPKSDFYRFSLERDEVASLVLATFQDGANDAPLALLDNAGEVLARSTVAGDGLTHSIDSFVAPATGTYFLHVSGTRLFPYSLLVTRDAAFNIEPNDDFATAQDISLVGGALGAVGAMDPLGDFYSLAVQQGDSLVIATSTPADGPFQPVNNLDPAVELFDPSGNLVASDDNGAADGHNVQLEYTATASGLYRVRVFGAAETSGDYVLKIDGATGSVAPLRVTSSDPPAGALLRRAPSEITIDFSFPILRPDTLDPAVLTVGGVAATGVSVIDGNTLRFDLPALEDATHEVVIAAAAITDIRGQANRAYHTELTIDSTGPRIISASIEEGSVLPAGALSIDLTFDDQLNPVPLQSLGAVLFGEVTRRNYVADRVQYASELTTSTLTLEFDDLPEDIYTLRLPSGNRAVEDLAGNDLDGEAGAFPTGDGQPGGDFVLQFSLDTDELPLRPFERLQPLGSLAFVSTGNFGIVNTSTDRDDHTFFVEAGEVVMATVTPTDPSVILTVELVGATGGVISAPAAGQPVVLSATIVTTAGTNSLRVGGDVAGAGYTLDVYRNVVVELEDSSEASPLNIDASATGVGPRRLAVLGTSFATGSETIFATTGSLWKYLDDNSDQGTAWREFDFDDSGWTKEGPSILGFGELGGGFGGGEVLPIATTVDSGPQGARYITTYFRREFDVPDPSIYESLSLELLRDDGAAVYLNGERIALSNLADGAAFDMVAINDANPETAYLPFSVDPGNLRVGRNVLAVEVHQGSNNSSDLGMDAILIGTVSEAAQRTIDSYTLDLTGLVGRSIDVVLAGQRGADYSGDLLELLDVDGATVLATATVGSLGAPADNYDLAILGFTVPAGGVYTLQLASSVPAGQYAIVVTTGALFESEPNDRASDPLRTLELGVTALGFLADAGIDAFDVVLEAGQSLTIAVRPLLGTAPSTPENTLDPRLRLLDGNQVEVAVDDNSAGGRDALLEFRAEQAGTYTILVESVSGQGEYALELLDSNAVRVIARHIFYNNSRFDGYDPAINAADDSAIAPDKQPLLNDEPAELANYTSFVSGINGIMVDVQNLADADDVNARQFVFRVGNTNDPDTWPLAPPPSRVTVREGAGINGSDRIVVTWPDGAIANIWLQITLRATIDTGLTEPDVFFVGNVVGDTGLGNQPDLVLVDQADRAATRSNSRSFFSPAPIDFPFDFNRDGLVDGVDRAIVRANLSAGIGGLILLNQAGGGPSPLAGLQFAVAAESPPIEADSQPVGVFSRPNERRSSARRAARRAAVRSVFDRLGRESVFSHRPATRYRAAGHGRLRIDARRDARIASVGRRRLAEAADLALETLIPDVVIESSRTNS